ncbi:MAG: peptidoglycan recognition family protein [Lawsonibacter sp.]|nr:peptidoglycan recognition family protein [Lawsonibacter sp.]
MNLRTCLLTANSCYKSGKTIVPRGVMVHSTGANNPKASRYVPGDAVIGYNTGGNHWNQSNEQWLEKYGTKLSKCVHALIGKFADGSVGTVKTLPWTMRGWHCASSGNDTHIAFEIGEDGLTDPAYFAAVYQEAVELTAYLCKTYGLDPLADGVVICHQEGYQRGIASNHGDVLHWFPKFGKSMDDFRAAVAAEIEGDNMLTEAQIRAIVRDEVAAVEAERAKLPASDWAKPHIQEAIGRGLMEKNTAGTIDRPQAGTTRQELATVANAIYEAVKG